MKNKGFGSAVFDVINCIILTFVIVVTVYPMLYVIFASVSDGTQFLKHSGLLLKPLGFTINAYKEVFKNSMIVSGYVTTLIILCIGVPLNILLTSFGAYFLSRREIMLSKAVMIIIMITMFFSGGMIPFLSLIHI